MSEAPLTWQGRLAAWLESNPKTMPENDSRRKLIKDFVDKFPKDLINMLTKEEYSLGHPSTTNDSFCYWLEWKTKPLGSVSGGNAKKWRLWYKGDGTWWYHPMFQSPDDAVHKMTAALSRLIERIEQGNFDEELPALDQQADATITNVQRLKPLHI